MTKHRNWKGSMKALENHIDPEKDEQLKWMKIGKYSIRERSNPDFLQMYWRMWDTALKPKRIQFKARAHEYCYPEGGYLWYTEWQLIHKIGNKVKKILKLARNINPGNKDGNLKKKAELIHLIEDFSQQYESLYSLYEDLRGEIKKRINAGDDDSSSSSTSTSDSESYYSPPELIPKSSEASSDNNPEAEISELDYKTAEVQKKADFEMENIPQADLESKIKGLEEEVGRLKNEIETVSSQKRELEEEFVSKSNETMEMKEKISRMEAEIGKKYEGNEQNYLSRISDVSAKANGLQIQVNNLKAQKSELEERVSYETKQRFTKVKSLMHHVDCLQHKLVLVNNQKSELELELKKKSDDEKSTAKDKIVIKDLEMEIGSLTSKKIGLEEQIKKIRQEAFQSYREKKELHRKIFELEKALSEKEAELLDHKKKFKDCEEDVSTQIKFWTDQVEILDNTLQNVRKEKKELEMELEKEKEKEKDGSSMNKSHLERRNIELTHKIENQQKTLLELGEDLNKLKNANVVLTQSKFLDSKSNFNLVEKKIEEVIEEFRKQFEDKYRILSRRIRVAEQLHVENKELYRKAKDSYEEETKSLMEKLEKSDCGVKNVKDMSIAANDFLVSLDPVALKFEECTANFLNRISKASCELKFAKDWAMRKNKALLHVRDDLDCLLVQLDDKEAEILVFREKVWKSENKVRELEKVIKEKEDGMLVLKEEKREAIRQLCVWIDYHRSRSDYYKKMLSEMNLGRRKT